MKQQPSKPLINPFAAVPEDILVLFFQYFTIRDLTSWGAVDRFNRSRVSTLGYDTYVSKHHSSSLRSSNLFPSRASWPSSKLARHLHLTSLHHRRRQFASLALALPPISSSQAPKYASQAQIKPLLAVGTRRIVAAGVGGRKGKIVIWDFESDNLETKAFAESELGEGWEVGFGEHIGTRITLTVEDELKGGLLGNDLTGLAFYTGPALPHTESEEEDEGEDEPESRVVLTFGNGLVQIVRIPSKPSCSEFNLRSGRPSNESSHTSKTSRKLAKARPTVPESAIPKLKLLHTVPHPASPVQSLLSTHSSLVTSLYSGLVSFYALSPLAPIVESETSLSFGDSGHLLSVPDMTIKLSSKPWCTHMCARSSTVAIGATSSSSPVSIYSISSSTCAPLRTLLPPIPLTTRTSFPTPYSVSSLSPHDPDLLISAWSNPCSAVLLHDVRVASARPVAIFNDPLAEESYYSCAGAEDGRVVLGGQSTLGRVGIWDVRMCGSGGQRKSPGWTVFVPGDQGGGKVGEIGSLEVRGGRVWGVTPARPFLLDFTPSPGLSSTISSLSLTGRLDSSLSLSSPREGRVENNQTVRWYEHDLDGTTSPRMMN
ncbi:WD40/YVTN repeat-like-containing domain [Phaffia rhodozyma]|uniref:WD40/YVTN repeat-like-containing domain n=1 Tax=Phaffia rhodozyma TaxID=264483 RepID=A0A0F7SIF4_PHARH|nr:WD40/YVTN repeat-like-containing domain [Phaffia rhodozyma]